MGWVWGYLATGVVVVALMVWHANSTRRQFLKQAEAHWENARRESERNSKEARANLQREAARRVGCDPVARKETA